MPGGTYKCRFTSEQLQRLHTSVGQLLGFLTRNPQFLKASASTGDTNETKTLWKRMISLQKRPQNEPAMKAEQKCLGDVQVTLQRTAHAAFLLAFLNDHMLSRLLERLPPEMQQRGPHIGVLLAGSVQSRSVYDQTSERGTERELWKLL
eukprot:tig00000789_g4138.t1